LRQSLHQGAQKRQQQQQQQLLYHSQRAALLNGTTTSTHGNNNCDGEENLAPSTMRCKSAGYSAASRVSRLGNMTRPRSSNGQRCRYRPAAAAAGIPRRRAVSAIGARRRTAAAAVATTFDPAAAAAENMQQQKHFNDGEFHQVAPTQFLPFQGRNTTNVVHRSVTTHIVDSSNNSWNNVSRRAMSAGVSRSSRQRHCPPLLASSLASRNTAWARRKGAVVGTSNGNSSTTTYVPHHDDFAVSSVASMVHAGGLKHRFSSMQRRAQSASRSSTSRCSRVRLGVLDSNVFRQ
jgi:hypothetical protein